MKKILPCSAILAVILLGCSISHAADFAGLVGVNAGTPQKISVPVLIPFTSNPKTAVYNCVGLEPGLTGQKVYLDHMMTAGGAGPVAWDLKASSLYMTHDAFGLRSNQLYLGAEIGGYVVAAIGSVGVYAKVSKKQAGPKLFVTFSLGLGWLPL